MQRGDDVHCTEASYQRKETSPPLRFIKAKLLDATSHVHLYCPTESLRKKLKEHLGPGAGGSHTNIMERFVKPGMLTQKGKQQSGSNAGLLFGAGEKVRNYPKCGENLSSVYRTSRGVSTGLLLQKQAL
jgi:DNA topoisomerase IA